MVKKLRSEAENPDYTLVVNRTQGRIMAYVHAAAHPVSRGRLADALGSSRTKVSAEVSNLVDLGLLAEEGLAESDGGRRSNLLGIPRSAGLVAAVDLGATSIDVALTTLGSGIVVYRGETADIQDGPKPVLKRAKTMLSELLHEQGDEPKDVLAIGIGVPGPVEQAAGVLRSPPIMHTLADLHLRVLLKESLYHVDHARLSTENGAHTVERTPNAPDSAAHMA